MNLARFPRAIEIQTTSYCNAGCRVCPHPQVTVERPNGTMSDALFDKILREAAPHAAELRLIPYFNAEPLMDPRFLHRLHRIAALCPGTEVEISTNLSLFHSTAWEELPLDVTELRISMFGFTPATHSALMPGLSWNAVWNNLQRLVADAGLRRRFQAVWLVMVEHHLVPDVEYDMAAAFCREHGLVLQRWGFLDRAGNVRDFSNQVDRKSIAGCAQDRPLQRLHVAWDGTVVLCCQDWRGTVRLGDLSRESIADVWHSEGYAAVRRAIYQGAGTAPALCRRCKLAVPA